jgi:hypothetical protein
MVGKGVSSLMTAHDLKLLIVILLCAIAFILLDIARGRRKQK